MNHVIDVHFMKWFSPLETVDKVVSRLQMVAIKRYGRPRNIPINEEEKNKIVVVW